MPEDKKFPIMVDANTMRSLITIIGWVHDNVPGGFMPKSVWNLYNRFTDVLQDGCFDHGIMRSKFQVDKISTESWCPLCSQKEHASAMHRAREFKGE